MRPEAKALLPRALALAVALVVLDQLTKTWLIGWMREAGGFVEVTGFFNLVMVWNRGISFGLFQSGDTGRLVLIGVSTLVSIGMVIWLARNDRPLTAYGIGAVIGGAVGNIGDRLFRAERAVADFFDFHVLGYHWPAFNVADAAITLGVAAILLDGLLADRRSAANGAG